MGYQQTFTMLLLIFDLSLYLPFFQKSDRSIARFKANELSLQIVVIPIADII